MNEYFQFLEKYNLWGGNTPQLGFIRHEYTDKIHRIYREPVGESACGAKACG